MSPGAHVLEAFAADLRAIGRHIHNIAHHPILELEILMAAIDDLKALEPRMDAVIQAMSTDTATAVAAATGPLNDEITALKNAAAQSETDLATEVGNITPKVIALETGVGITFTPPAPEPLTPPEPTPS